MDAPAMFADDVAEFDEVLDGYELIDGDLVQKNVSMESSWVAVRLIARMEPYCGSQQLGWVFGGDAGYRCFPHRPKLVRKPDASFLALGRIDPKTFRKGDCRIPPNLAVEVISPNDLAFDHEQKIEEYLAAGVALVWAINPETWVVMVHRADGTVTKLRETDRLDGENVVPGFSCLVGELLLPVSAS